MNDDLIYLDMADRIASNAIDEYPYGEKDKPETYCEYNEGWTAACMYILHKLIELPTENKSNAWLQKQKDRMCRSNILCMKCPLGVMSISKTCEAWMIEHPLLADTIIRKWAAEHPEKMARTRQDLILEAFPNVKLVDGCINVCTHNFKKNPECRGSEGCSECMRDFWLAPAEGEENNGLEKDHQG